MKRLVTGAVILAGGVIAVLVVRAHHSQTHAPSLAGRPAFGFSDNGHPGRLTAAQYQAWLASLRLDEAAIRRQMKPIEGRLLRIERTSRHPSGRAIAAIRSLQAKLLELAQQEAGIRDQEYQARCQAGQLGGLFTSPAC